jgi:uncharacterized membrane protein
MLIFINAFLIGTASGLRSLIGLAAVSWAAHAGILTLDHTWLAFLGYSFTPYILTLLAIGELVGLSGNGMIIGLVAGIIGAVAGTFGGAKARSLLAKAFGRDLPAALLEDTIAVSIVAFALFR